MLQIRIMNQEDYASVYRLWLNTPGMGLNTTDDSQEGIGRYLRRNPATSFVAEADGKIIGAILAGHDGRRGYIYHTAVLPDYRNQGVARELVEEVLEALDREGIQKAALVVFGDNELGNGFWQAMGFTPREDLVYRNKNIHSLENINT